MTTVDNKAESHTFDIEMHHANNPVACLVLGHGAGAGKEHDFMQDMAQALVSKGIAVVLFNFPYMQTINSTGKRRPPDKAEKLMAHFDALIEHCSIGIEALHNMPVFIGGKSMGGRMATMVYESVSNVKGAIALGYPFHPPGKPDKTRTEHLLSATKPLIIIQGERDTFGTKAEVESYALPSEIQCAFLEDGDHSFKPRKASGKTQQEHIEKAATLTAAFINQVVNT
ncbi:MULTISPECIES: alpha/beta family hydrolase [Alteromonas]|uniref:alpha/beta family hydrolase n=1 Tax=Alteromonas TaxID=226 RepID=UPI000355765F|nr:MULTISPECIES: alpha/beta family hydrolase [Alteromonas]AGP81437.1 alpha/beta-hydrolase fold hydrolase [Alteromonas mediterranea MED64]NQY15963.1 dienelactone hydrolase family protein [Alteromonas sp.]